ncbi:MAG: hypothetical protein ABSH42_07205 [Bryobacteraceae bacterium]|jgi:hypothetical protein
MNLQWLQMRIGEEQERRQREDNIRKRMPSALEELYGSLTECLESYKQAFGARAAVMHFVSGRMRIEIREEVESRWVTRAEIVIANDLTIPGFRIERGAEPYLIEVGVLAGDKLFYRDGDDYITLEELTRRILDRSLFPKLAA